MANEPTGTLVERIEFRAVAPASKTNLKGLDDALAKLTAMDAAVKNIQARLGNIGQPVLFRKTAADIKEMISAAEKLGRFGKAAGGSFKAASMKPADLAKAMGFDPKAIESFLTQGMLGGKSKAQQEMKRTIREIYNAAEGEFRSISGASKGFSLFTKQYNPQTDVRNALQTILGGGSPQSSVPGPQSSAPAASAARARKPAKAAEGEEKEELSFGDKLAGIKRELAESLRTNDLNKIEAARKQAAQQVRALVGPEGANPGSGKKFDDAMAYAAMQDRLASDAAQKQIVRQGSRTADMTSLRDKQNAEMEKAQADAVKEAEAEELAARKERIASERVRSRLRAQRAKAAQADDKQRAGRTAGLNNLDAVQLHWQNFLAMGGVETPESGAMKLTKKGYSRQLIGERSIGGGRTEVFTATMGEANATMERYTKAAKEAKDAQSAWLGDFVKNTAKVAAWSLSVGVLYKTLTLLETSFSGLVNIGMQMARLDQVFKKIGGTTQELTIDILHLAAANGRSSEEAMNSALQWARLGLSRVQVNEAVTVSLMAANDANESAAETTEKLQAIMQTYGLQVGNLRTVLGEIVQITNSYNVSTGQMLEGITRTAAAAKQAGLPLAELMGILGATIGSTGQTGANIGNAIKSITLALSNPALQELLRSRYRVEVTTGGEQLKNMSQLLSDIFVRYEKLGNLERQSMLFSVAGRTQANRMAALLDNYVRSQTLAINAQLNLNAAEEENKKILATMHAQLQGVATEWERFVVIQGGHGPVTAITEITKAFRNLLSVANTPIGSAASTGILALLTAASAKTILTGLTAAGSQKSFVGRTFAQVGAAARETGSWMQLAVARFLGAGVASDIMFGSPTYGKSMLVGAPAMASGGGNPWASRNLNNPWSRNPLGWGKSAVEPMVGKLAAVDQSLMRWGASMAVSNTAGRAFAGTLQAVTKALQVGLIALGEWLIPLAVIAGGIWAFNKAMDAIHGSTTKAEEALAGFNSEAERASAAANAFGQAARLMMTAQNALSTKGGSMRPEDAAKMVNQMAEVMFLDEPDLKRQKAKTDEFRKQAGLLLEQKNYGKLAAVADETRLRYLKVQRDERQKQFEALKKQDRSDEAELKSIAAAEKRYGFVGRSGRSRTRDEIEERMAERQGKKVQYILDTDQEIADAEERQLEYSVEHLSALERQRNALVGIAEIYGQMKSTNPYEKANIDLAKNQALASAAKKQMESLTREGALNSDELAAASLKRGELEKQEATIRERIMDLKNQPGVKFDTDPLFKGAPLLGSYTAADEKRDQENVRRERLSQEEDKLQGIEAAYKNVDAEAGGTRVSSINKRFAEAKAEFNKYSAAAGGIAGNMPLYEAQARFQFGQQQSERGLRTQSYGYSEGDKLVRERKYLDQDIEGLEKKITEAERTGTNVLELKSRLIEDIYLRNKNNLDLLERQADVERDIKQLKIDQNKEFMRSFFGAGPAEMLQKLTAFRMSRNKPLSQGAFFAMGPEMRNNYGMLNTDFNPQMLELKNERSQVNRLIHDIFGPRTTPGGITLEKPKTPNDILLKFSTDLSKAMQGLDKMFPTETFDAAKTAVDHLASAADRTAEALGRLADRIDGMTPGGHSVPVSPQSGGTGGGRGHARHN